MIHIPVEVLATALLEGCLKVECHVGQHLFGQETLVATWKQEKFQVTGTHLLSLLAKSLLAKLEPTAEQAPQPETVWEKVCALLENEGVDMAEFDLGVQVIRARLFNESEGEHNPNDPTCPANNADTFNHPVECLCSIDNQRVDIGAPVG